MPKWLNRLVMLVLILCTCCSPAPGQSAPPATPTAVHTDAPAWSKLFEGPQYGAFLDLTLTPDGNVLAVGATNHLHMPPYSGDVLLIKLSLDGSVLWERAWGGNGYDQADGVVPADDEGYYVFGETESYGAGDRDFFLLKLSADGQAEWHRTYGGTDREWPYGLLHLANADLLIYGFSTTTGGGRDRYALRLSPAGDILWEYSAGTPAEELLLDALELPSGDLILAASLDEDGELVRLSADGVERWVRRFELPGWQYPSQVALTSNGGLLLAGFAMAESPRQADTWLARCTPDGELLWQTTFGEPSFDDYATSLLRLRDGTYLSGALANGVLLTRLDEDGHVLWSGSYLDKQRVYGGMGLVELEQGGCIVAGLIQLVNGRSYDAVILRVDDLGQE